MGKDDPKILLIDGRDNVELNWNNQIYLRRPRSPLK